MLDKSSRILNKKTDRGWTQINADGTNQTAFICGQACGFGFGASGLSMPIRG
jgi:hypothetical protein